MFSLRHLLLIVALVLVSSTITHAQSPKRCTKPRWKRAITTSASPYLTGSMTGASQAVLAEKCRRKCMADAPCMAYEYTATGPKQGTCELFTAGSMVRASRKNAAGVCKFVNSNPRPCPPGLVWDAKLKRCVPKTVTPQGDNSTDGNPNTDPNDCPPGWIWNPDTNKCTPKDVLPPEDHNSDGLDNDPSGCPPGWIWNQDTNKCTPKDVLPPEDHNSDGLDNDPAACPPGWIWNPDTNKCTPKDVLPPEDHNMDDPTSYQCSDFDDVNTPESRHRCESHHGCVFVPESTTWGRCVARI